MSTELPASIPADNGDRRWLVSTRHGGQKYLTIPQLKARMKALSDELDELESELNRLTLAGMNGAQARRMT